MPTIKITDELGAELVVANASPASALTKYLRGPLVHLVAAKQLAAVLRQPLSSPAPGPIAVRLGFKDSVGLGGADTELSVDAGVEAAVIVTGPGQDLFDDDHFGEPLSVAPGQSYVSFVFAPRLAIGVGSAAARGDLTFGFTAGTSLAVRSSRRFSLGSGEATVGEALKAVLAHLSLPGDVEDLEQMPVGAVASVAGTGRLTLAGTYDLATVVNPLATTVPFTRGNTVGITAGASLAVAAEWTLEGEFEMRAVRTDAGVALGFYKKRGSAFSIDVNATAGADITFGKRQLFERLIRALSDDPEADLRALVNAGLSDEQIEDIEAAIQASVNRSLSVALEMEFSALAEDEAAFLYDIDLGMLDEVGRRAVHDALDGDLAAMSRLETSPDPHGVTLRSSRTERLRRKGLSLSLNLLGIVNLHRISELVRRGRVLYEPLTGALVIADEITAKRVAVAGHPLAADGQKLRKVVFESLMMTAVYRASHVTEASMVLESSQTYFEAHSKTNRRVMADHLDAIIALGLRKPAERNVLLGHGVEQYGPSTLLLETSFDDAGCTGLFLDESGKPREEQYYERVGRDAMLALVQPDDADDYRRVPLAADTLWNQMKDAGQFNFRSVLPRAIASDSRRTALVVADYTLIRWWAASMGEAAEWVHRIRAFIGGSGREPLKDNKKFLELRRSVERSLAKAIGNSKSQFDDPWGLVAMDAAAGGRAAAKAILVSPQLSLFASRAVKATEVPHAERGVHGGGPREIGATRHQPA